MPVVLGRDAFDHEVGLLEAIGGLELPDRLLDTTRPPQLVTVHMPRVRNIGCKSRVCDGVCQRLLDAAGILVRVYEVMVRREVIGDDFERFRVEANGARSAALAVIRGV